MRSNLKGRKKSSKRKKKYQKKGLQLTVYEDTLDIVNICLKTLSVTGGANPLTNW